jgi:GNAT superfamily N-acetyltransferase
VPGPTSSEACAPASGPESCRSDVRAVAELASLFELYRIHYGQSPAPAATRAWVGEMARSGELEFYGANHGPRMVGFAAIHQVPASHVLGRFWQLRDLFVDTAKRRQGIARQLVVTIRQAATDAGALRLSLQTEPDKCRGSRAVPPVRFHD